MADFQIRDFRRLDGGARPIYAATVVRNGDRVAVDTRYGSWHTAADDGGRLHELTWTVKARLAERVATDRRTRGERVPRR